MAPQVLWERGVLAGIKQESKWFRVLLVCLLSLRGDTPAKGSPARYRGLGGLGLVGLGSPLRLWEWESSTEHLPPARTPRLTGTQRQLPWRQRARPCACACARAARTNDARRGLGQAGWAVGVLMEREVLLRKVSLLQVRGGRECTWGPGLETSLCLHVKP